MRPTVMMAICVVVTSLGGCQGTPAPDPPSLFVLLDDVHPCHAGLCLSSSVDGELGLEGVLAGPVTTIASEGDVLAGAACGDPYQLFVFERTTGRLYLQPSDFAGRCDDWHHGPKLAFDGERLFTTASEGGSSQIWWYQTGRLTPPPWGDAEVFDAGRSGFLTEGPSGEGAAMWWVDGTNEVFQLGNVVDGVVLSTGLMMLAAGGVLWQVDGEIQTSEQVGDGLVRIGLVTPEHVWFGGTDIHDGCAYSQRTRTEPSDEVAAWGLRPMAASAHLTLLSQCGRVPDAGPALRTLEGQSLADTPYVSVASDQSGDWGYVVVLRHGGQSTVLQHRA